MSAASSDEKWVVCVSCGEIVQRSADPRMQAQYHSATCPAQANPQTGEASRAYELPAGVAFADEDAETADETAGVGAVWLTDGTTEATPEAGSSAQPRRPPPPPQQQQQQAPRPGKPVRPRLFISLGLAALVAVAGGLYAGLHGGGTPSSGRARLKPSHLVVPGTAGPASPASRALPGGRASNAAARPGSATQPGSTVPGAGQLPASATCTTSAALGSCGPYSYPQITGMTAVSGIGIANNVWNPVSGWAQTLRAASPGDWSVTASMPAGNTTVVSYPSLQADYVQSTSTSVPLSDYTSIYSSFSETMNATSQTSAWATYEVSIGQGSGVGPADDVMIENDLADAGSCTGGGTATFGGSGGVPMQNWNLCTYGTELVWQLASGNEGSGTVDVLAMLNWLVSHGQLPQDAGLFSISYGWQICSTGGQNENFQVSRFSVTTTPS
jgi:hypothetical protein